MEYGTWYSEYSITRAVVGVTQLILQNCFDAFLGLGRTMKMNCHDETSNISCDLCNLFPIAFLRLVFENHIQSTEIESNSAYLANSTRTTLSRDVGNHNRSHTGLSVLSYSLYGNKSSYVCGMVETAKQDYSVYPGWELRVYHNNQVPVDILRKLESLQNVRLINVVRECPEWVARPTKSSFLAVSCCL
jgi:hypothetical protein